MNYAFTPNRFRHGYTYRCDKCEELVRSCEIKSLPPVYGRWEILDDGHMWHGGCGGDLYEVPPTFRAIRRQSLLAPPIQEQAA
jgi:hypothetical protein